MVELLLIAHLLVQHNQLPLDLAALHDLGRKAFLYLGELLLLDFGGRLLELLGHLLLDLALLLDLQSETNGSYHVLVRLKEFLGPLEVLHHV